MRRRILACLIAVLVPALVWAAAGTATKTETTAGAVKRLVWAWTAGTAGDAGTVASTTTAVYTGQLVLLETIPGTGADAPTADYDITITDASGYDVLRGAGNNRQAVAKQYVGSEELGAVAVSQLTLNVSGAGSAKKGTVVIWIR